MAFDEDFSQDAYQAGNWNLIQFRLCWKLETYIQDIYIYIYKSSWPQIATISDPKTL